MNRRDAVVALAALGVPSLAWGQTGAKVRRVGYLAFQSRIAAAGLYEVFKLGMHDLGWREGQNVEYRVAYADGQVERLDALAQELVEQKVEVILVGGTPQTRAAKKATNTIPIVMTNVSNAVEGKFVASLARPGGNITGISSQYDEVLGKLIEILHETVPRARRIAILMNESNTAHPGYWSAAQRTCAALKLVAIRAFASAPNQLAGAIAQIVREKAQAIVVVADAVYLNERVRLEELVRATRLPAAYALREHVVAGGLLSYASNLSRSFQYAARFVDKILKGAKPADLPVEQPTIFELVINMKTANALGIKVPLAVRIQANEVIE